MSGSQKTSKAPSRFNEDDIGYYSSDGKYIKGKYPMFDPELKPKSLKRLNMDRVESEFMKINTELLDSFFGYDDSWVDSYLKFISLFNNHQCLSNSTLIANLLKPSHSVIFERWLSHCISEMSTSNGSYHMDTTDDPGSRLTMLEESFKRSLLLLVDSIEAEIMHGNRKRRMLKSLAFLAHSACAALDRCVLELEGKGAYAQKSIKDISGKMRSWPMNMGIYTKDAKQAIETIERLGVGKDFVKDKRCKKTTSISSMYADLLIDYITSIKDGILAVDESITKAYPFSSGLMRKIAQLPPFSLKSHKDWFEVGWEILMVATDNNPGYYADLESLGSHKAKRYKTTNTSGRVSTERPITDIKDGIKSRLMVSFKIIAKRRPSLD